MAAIEQKIELKGARHLLLWLSWILVIWFLVVWVDYKFSSPLSGLFDKAAMLSGISSFTGVVLGVAYLCFGLWSPIRWRMGIAALALNATFLAFFGWAVMNP